MYQDISDSDWTDLEDEVEVLIGDLTPGRWRWIEDDLFWVGNGRKRSWGPTIYGMSEWIIRDLDKAYRESFDNPQAFRYFLVDVFGVPEADFRAAQAYRETLLTKRSGEALQHTDSQHPKIAKTTEIMECETQSELAHTTSTTAETTNYIRESEGDESIIQDANGNSAAGKRLKSIIRFASERRVSKAEGRGLKVKTIRATKRSGPTDKRSSEI